MKFILFCFHFLRKPLGAVYSARAPNGVHVAIKVIDISGMGHVIGETLVESYLTEVKHLERLRQKSDHVVTIYDFDFDRHTGRGKLEILQMNISKVFLFI
jgi:hypothetical protein